MSTAFAGTLPSTPASRYARCGDMRTLRYPPSRMPTNAYSTPGIKRREPRTRFWARRAWMTEPLLRDAAHSNATASPFSARAQAPSVSAITFTPDGIARSNVHGNRRAVSASALTGKLGVRSPWADLWFKDISTHEND